MNVIPEMRSASEIWYLRFNLINTVFIEQI